MQTFDELDECLRLLVEVVQWVYLVAGAIEPFPSNREKLFSASFNRVLGSASIPISVRSCKVLVHRIISFSVSGTKAASSWPKMGCGMFGRPARLCPDLS